MTNRIRQVLKNSDNKLLIPFFTAGYPDMNQTLDFLKIAENNGADIIELGVPFSDPMADGPQIQFSSKVALDNGFSLAKLYKLIESFRKVSETPLVLMGYYNPLIAQTEKKFIRNSKNAGADGYIIPDLPVEEADSFLELCKMQEQSLTFLASPTSSKERIKLINSASTDFVYAVTVTGVTGTGKKFDNKTDKYLVNLKKQLTKKVVAGFGVSDVTSAKRLSKNTDGIVIGSKIVQIINESKNKREMRLNLEKFLTEIRKAI